MSTLPGIMGLGAQVPRCRELSLPPHLHFPGGLSSNWLWPQRQASRCPSRGSLPEGPHLPYSEGRKPPGAWATSPWGPWGLVVGRWQQPRTLSKDRGGVGKHCQVDLRCCRRQGSREGLEALVALVALGGQVDPVREQKALVSHVHSQAIDDSGQGGRCGRQHF